MYKSIINIALWSIAVAATLIGGDLLVRAFLFDQFIIPTESMLPTLIPGDRVIVDKTVMGARLYEDFTFNPEGGELKCMRLRGTRGLRRNDIAVFNFPHHNDKINFVINNVYAKRCVALPGDSISAVNGHYVNNNHDGVLGVEQEQDILGATPDSLIYPPGLHTLPHDYHIPWTIKNFGPLYTPRKGDIIRLTPREAVIYKLVLEWETGKQIETDWEKGEVRADGKIMKRHQFTHDYYFFCGDNVCNSNDSRYWGFVPEEYIVGVVKYISYSEDPQTGKRREERKLKRIEDI